MKRLNVNKVISSIKENPNDNCRKTNGSQAPSQSFGSFSISEVWKDVKGYEGFYQVSSFARVKRLEYLQKNPLSDDLCRHKEKIIKQRFDRYGYLRICLNDVKRKPIKKYITVHRLVAIAFVENPFGETCINHLDNNRSNNNISNLQWCTPRENQQHMYKQQRHPYGIKVNTNKLTEKQVLEIRKIYGGDGRKYRNKKIKGKLNQFDIAKKYKVTPANIRSIVHRLIWKHI